MIIFRDGVNFNFGIKLFVKAGQNGGNLFCIWSANIKSIIVVCLFGIFIPEVCKRNTNTRHVFETWLCKGRCIQTEYRYPHSPFFIGESLIYARIQHGGKLQSEFTQKIIPLIMPSSYFQNCNVCSLSFTIIILHPY